MKEQEAGNSGQCNGEQGQDSYANGIGLEVVISSDSGKAATGGELQSSAVADSRRPASIGVENKEVEAEGGGIQPNVGLANTQTGGGQINGDCVNEKGDVLKEKVPTEEQKSSSSCVIDVKCDVWEKVCRICHLGSEGSEESTTDSPAAVNLSSTAELIQLGCGCKDELGVAHAHCAAAWFKLKGNKVCEICGETAKNITCAVAGDSSRFLEEWNQVRFVNRGGRNSQERGGGCWRGQPFCNFLMACLVIAFVLPWFFRVNMF